jgi:hypothetical protein
MGVPKLAMSIESDLRQVIRSYRKLPTNPRQIGVATRTMAAKDRYDFGTNLLAR